MRGCVPLPLFFWPFQAAFEERIAQLQQQEASSSGSSQHPGSEPTGKLSGPLDPLPRPPRPPPPGLPRGVSAGVSSNSDDDATAPPKLTPRSGARADSAARPGGSAAAGTAPAGDRSRQSRGEGGSGWSGERRPTLKPRALAATNLSASRVSAAVSLSRGKSQPR